MKLFIPIDLRCIPPPSPIPIPPQSGSRLSISGVKLCSHSSDAHTIVQQVLVNVCLHSSFTLLLVPVSHWLHIWAFLGCVFSVFPMCICSISTVCLHCLQCVFPVSPMQCVSSVSTMQQCVSPLSPMQCAKVSHIMEQ